jgi:glutathione S-transferase
MYELYIANKNYSSWSLRPWVLLRELQIPFVEHLVPFSDQAAWDAYKRITPNSKVPCLIDGEDVIWDSLAIVEYVAERHRQAWPADRTARAWARCAAAEMHSGFQELRNRCSMTCGQTVKLHEFPPALERDVARINALWVEGLQRFKGPFLAGNTFTAVDAFFAPVVFRARSYGLPLDPPAADYAARMLNLPSMRDWYTAGIAEQFRDSHHDEDIRQMGTITEDVRALV